MIIKKACAYVRVSTKSSNQLHSFTFQKKYWTDYFDMKKQYVFVGIFADEGISGKSVKNRNEFKKMITQANNKEIDMIFVKSISRFSRNMLELLKVVNELRDKNVGVYFEKENINTLDSKSIFILNILSRVAEEELISISKNQKWAVRKRFLQGKVELNGRILGYDLVKTDNGSKLIINAEQAKIVRTIYRLYMEGNGRNKIAQYLEDKNYKTATNSLKWSPSSINKILRNEKYIGDALLQKSYKDNFVKVINKRDNPVVPMIYIENDHDSIIDKKLFDEVQKKIKDNEYLKLNGSSKKESLFSGKIVCEKCGKKYLHKQYYYKKQILYSYYSCETYQTKGKGSCDNSSIKEDILIDLFKSCLIENNNKISNSNQIKKLQNDLNQLILKEREIYKKIAQNKEKTESVKYELEIILDKINVLEQQVARYYEINKEYKIDENTLINGNFIFEILDKVVISNKVATFIFYNGNIFRREFSNGRAGNVNGKLCKKNNSNSSEGKLSNF